MRSTVYIWVLLIIAPIIAQAQSSIMSTSNITNNTTSTSTTTNTSTSTANVTNSGAGTIYTTINNNPPLTPAQQAAINGNNGPNRFRNQPRAFEAVSDLDTPRKGFDDPRDPWDGRYSNDNPRNYSDGTDQLAAHAAARQAFVNRASPNGAMRNYQRGGVTYGPVHTK